MAYDPERIVSIGELEKRGKTVRFGIKEKDRSRHIYVIGQTGTGKSTLLEMLAMQDIRNGTGLIFMDPHGQSVEALLHYVTPAYLDRIIYFAPHHQERPIGLNIMEDIGYDKRHLVVSSLMASFEKIWGAGTWSDRMAYILQNTLLALIEYPGTTLLDVGRMYSSKGFREKVVANLKDPQVRKYWVEEFANYTERYAQEATPSIQNKLGQFTSNPLMRNIIGQKESAFNFREIMDEGKILLVNLSKGQIGENNARMLGVLFTTKIYLAALSRSDMTKAELEAANPCNFFVDEFQSFANSSFSDILSEARKYKLNLVMAHQYLGQLYSDDAGGGDVIRDAVFGNVGTFISFRVGPVDAEIIAKQFAPDIMEEDLVALPRYHIYLTLNIDGAGSTPFSARTFYEPAPEGVSLEEEVVQRTMDVYGVDRAIVEKMVADNLAEDAQSNEAETAKRSGGQKGGGQKHGWKQGGGQRSAGQQGGGHKGGGQQRMQGKDQSATETHTPLKGLVQQVMEHSDQQKQRTDESKKHRDGSRKVSGMSGRQQAKGQSDRSDGRGSDVKREKARTSEQSVAERSQERAGSDSNAAGEKRAAGRKVDISEQKKKESPRRQVEQGGERGRVMKREGGDVSGQSRVKKSKERKGYDRGAAGKGADTSAGVVSEKRQRGDKEQSVSRGAADRLGENDSASEKRQDTVRGSESASVAGVSREQRSSSEEKRRMQGRKSRDAVSEHGQHDRKKYPVSDGDGRRSVPAAQSTDRERDRGRSDRQSRGQEERGVARSEKQRQGSRKNHREKSSQKRDIVERSVVSTEKESGVSAKQQQQIAAHVTEDTERQAGQSQLPDALRRPNGIVAGSVSRSAVTQQITSEQQSASSGQRVVQSDVSGGQRDTQDVQQERSAQKKGMHLPRSGGLGDLVKATKGSGLRKDLKVAPKKARDAPPISYEEGWVAIGDLRRG